MRQIRYQIFVSSTFRDLHEEPQAVLDAILNMNHFPAGMELFPASDSTPWEVIERVIDDSDYYVLIVGGMYGSTDSSGISYTEREYDYAKRTNKPVLAFLHQNPDAIPAGKAEMIPAAQKKLREFREKLQNHHCKYWQDEKELQYKVAISLIQEINFKPALGWVRASEASNEDLLRRIARLTQENERLRELTQAQTPFNQTAIPFLRYKYLRSIYSEHLDSVKLYYSYSHRDESLRNEFETHLKILERQSLIASWNDRNILPGEIWTDQVDENIETADIIVFLISADFLASGYCDGAEVRRAIQRHEEGGARVVPVILRSTNWASSPFGQLPVLPKDGQPITLWSDRDSAWNNVSNGIEALANSLRRPAGPDPTA